MSVVAIEISPSKILLVAGRKASNRPLEVSLAIEIPVEADLDDEALAEKLKQAVQEHGLARNDAIVVLSRSQCELRELELPPAPDAELPDMVMFKAKGDFASFNDRWLLDFICLDQDETKPRKVLASAIAPGVKERVENIIEPTGLRLKKLVLRPFAIMDLLTSRTDDGIARLVVNPGDQFTDVVVTRGNQVISARSIRLSFDHSTDQRNQQLISEVRRTLASSKRSLGGSSIEHVILVDDEKTNKHLLGNLGERLGIDVEIYDPFAGIARIGQAKNVSQPWPYAPLLGSIIHHGNEESAPAIDFLNPRRREELVVDRSRWWLYGGLAGLAAAMILFFGWWTLSSQSAEIAQLKQDLIDAIELNESTNMDSIIGRTGQIDKWQQLNIRWLDELDEMSKRFLTADEVMVSNFSAALKRNGPSVDLSGKIVSVDQDRKLYESLESRPYVVTPTKAEVSDGDSDYPYLFGSTLAIELKGDQWLRELDKHVDAFHKKRRATSEVAEGSVN